MTEQPFLPAASPLLDAALARSAARLLPVAELFDIAAQLGRAGAAQLAPELYKAWIALNPDDPLAFAVYFNYAVCLSDAGDKPGAINALRAAQRIAPDFHPPYINLGRCLEEVGQLGPAVAQWTDLVHRLGAVTGEALGHKLIALEQIGRVLEAAGEDALAEDALRLSLDLKADQPEVAQHWVALRMRRCLWPAVESWERASRRQLVAGVSPLSLANLADDPMFQLAAADRYCRASVGLAAPVARPPRPAGERLRIGYLSSDLREHAVGFALADLFETHDRGAVEVHAYYCGVEREDPTRRRLRAAADRWTDVNGLDDDAAARTIADDGIDILVDLNGYTKSARTGIFARRPAPVAVNWFGFPGTMGSPYHHYMIADPVTVPEEYERFYAEKVVRLPCYQPNDRRRPVAAQPSRADEGLPDEAVVFCCLNGTQKITEAAFGRWMRILRDVPEGVLWLLGAAAETEARLRARAGAAGVAPERLVFAAKRSNPEHLARYPLADLFLDTLPYGAHTTAADALWMGVPVLTLPGRSFAARVCASVVTAAGLPELVCDGSDNYVAFATALGRDRAALARVRAKLAAGRDTCPLFDTPRLATALEGLYSGMWADHAAGRLPVPRLDGLDRYHAVGLDLDLEGAEGLDEEAYRARWRAGLTRWDAAYPMAPDGRLWPGRGAPDQVSAP